MERGSKYYPFGIPTHINEYIPTQQTPHKSERNTRQREQEEELRREGRVDSLGKLKNYRLSF